MSSCSNHLFEGQELELDALEEVHVVHAHEHRLPFELHHTQQNLERKSRRNSTACRMANKRCREVRITDTAHCLAPLEEWINHRTGGCQYSVATNVSHVNQQHLLLILHHSHAEVRLTDGRTAQATTTQ